MRFFLVGILTGIVISNSHNQKLFMNIASKGKEYFGKLDVDENYIFDDDIIDGEVTEHEGRE